MNDQQFDTVMEHIIEALRERGYDPFAQLTGYVTLEEPSYITTHKNARKIIQTLDFERVKQYVEAHTKTKL